jgi:carbonyl reductase 1
MGRLAVTAGYYLPARVAGRGAAAAQADPPCSMALLPPPSGSAPPQHRLRRVSDRRRRLTALRAALAPHPPAHRPGCLGAAPAITSACNKPPRVAVVTGANKGVGLAIAKGLALLPGYHVVLCARDPAKGAAAVSRLVSEDGVPAAQLSSRQLDIDDPASIDRFVAWFETVHVLPRGGGLGALVNNAAIQIEAGSPAALPSFADQAAPSLHTNFHQTAALTEALLPMLAPDARLVFVSSMAGTAAWGEAGEALRERVKGATIPALKAMGREFVAMAEAGTEAEAGWPRTTYGTSKMLLIAYARQLARRYAATDVRVNACCPGFCATDMTLRPGGITPTGADMGQDRGQQPVEAGAETPLWLATLPTAPPPGLRAPTGGMFGSSPSREMMDAPGWW